MQRINQAVGATEFCIPHLNTLIPYFDLTFCCTVLSNIFWLNVDTPVVLNGGKGAPESMIKTL